MKPILEDSIDYLDWTLPTAAENLALDEALLLQAEQGEGRSILRIWESKQLAVILGAGCFYKRDVNAESCSADAIPILRRSSGGGTVLIGPGCLCYSLVLEQGAPGMATITSSYRAILDRIAFSLRNLQGSLAMAGTSDLVVMDRKFSGNAQQRKRTYLLHHGTLLYAFDLDLIERYLRPPDRQPEYRLGRPHREFVRNLAVGRESLVACLRSAWAAENERHTIPVQLVDELVRNKYGRPEWTTRR